MDVQAQTFEQILNPVGGSLAISAMLAALPLLVLFVLLGGFRMANETGLSATLMAASNSSAGVLGKMLSLQNLAIASAAVGLEGAESTLFRKLIGWSLGLLVLMTLLIWLQSTSVLGWMVP